MTSLRKILTVAAMTGMLALAACGKPSQADLLDKAADAQTRTELEAALGKPDSISKFGPIETWVYEADTGVVKFDLAGDSIRMRRSEEADEEGQN